MDQYILLGTTLLPSRLLTQISQIRKTRVNEDHCDVVLSFTAVSDWCDREVIHHVTRDQLTELYTVWVSPFFV